MAIQLRNTLKGWFSTGKKPTASQFADWIDSFWHKSEDSIPAAKIDGLQTLLDEKGGDAPADGQQYARKENDWSVVAASGGAAEREITAPAAWDGSAYAIDLSVEKQYTLTVNDGVTAAEFSLTFPTDVGTKSREIVVRIDNSGNTGAIETITWTGNWVWAVGDPVTGIAAGKVVELVVRNISNDTVKAYTDTEN